MARCLICSCRTRGDQWIDPRQFGVQFFDGAFCVYCCPDCLIFMIWTRDTGKESTKERQRYWIKKYMNDLDGDGYMHTQCLECAKIGNVSWDGLCSTCIEQFSDGQEFLMQSQESH